MEHEIGEVPECHMFVRIGLLLFIIHERPICIVDPFPLEPLVGMGYVRRIKARALATKKKHGGLMRLD